AAVATDDVDIVEYNAMRRTIAKRLTESKQNTPHIYVTVEIAMEELLSTRERLNAGAGDGTPKVSVNDCIVRACALALMENPNVNSRFENNRRVTPRAAHIGVAVSLPDGLIVPVVRSAQSKSLRAIAVETKRLAEVARAGKLQPADYQGGSFTISNMGAIADVDNFAAIINPGEGAILAVAATRTVPAVMGGQLVVGKRMKVTLSADHRVVDGADAARFLGSLKRLLENPLELLA
ncbi:MAG: dihydrolipoamide acetyltransferase family protein, partial [Armatimonadota bacterium]